MDQPEPQPADFPAAFEDAFARLQLLVAESCRGRDFWPTSVARTIVAALDLVATDPAAGRALTTGALSYGAFGSYLHRKAVEYLAASLAACVEGGRRQGLPEIVEEALVGGVFEVVSAYLRNGREDELPTIAPQVIELTLLPYLGAREARRVALEAMTGA